MFGNLGLPEILIILVLILLLFGAKRIPEIAGSFGKGITEFKRNLNDAQRAITEVPPPRDETRSIGADRTPVDRVPVTPDEEEAVRQPPKRLLG